MSFPLTAAQVREVIDRLEQVERWLNQQESTASAPGPHTGYRRGGPSDRARAVGPLSRPRDVFPAIPLIANLWKVVEPAGPDFIGEPFSGIESGPGPVPAICRDVSDFVSSDEREGLQRVDIAYSAGFWARAALETFTPITYPIAVSDPPTHYIVLRASGLGGFVRFASKNHFDRFLAQSSSEDLIAHGFASEAEIQVFCQGAKIAVPARYAPA